MLSMSSSFAYQQVDVFAPTAFNGNGLGVVFDADCLTEDQMQRFAQWVNMSETVFFVAPTHPEADYAVRIFTPSTELPFAGHPTLGAAHAWLEAGGQAGPSGRLVQECGSGLVQLRVEREPDASHPRRIAFAAPELTRFEPLDPDTLDWALRGLRLNPEDVLDHRWLVNGPNPVGLLVRDADVVLGINPDYAAMEGLEIGVIGPYTSSCAARTTWQPRESIIPRVSGTREELRPLDASDLQRSEERFGSVVLQPPADFEVRAFVAGEAVPEDPATGSLNAGFGQWLVTEGYAPQRYTVRQGTMLGREAILHVEAEDRQVWVSGDVQTRISGSVSFD